MRIGRPPTQRRSSMPMGIAIAHDAFLLAFFFVAGKVASDHCDDWPRCAGMRLPAVWSGRPDRNPDPCRLIIDVFADGTTMVGGARRGDSWLRDALLVEALLSRAADGWSGRVIQIRADERTPFRHIQRIIDLCRDPAIRIWRLEFAVGRAEGDWPCRHEGKQVIWI